jgi:hypothetical protein
MKKACVAALLAGLVLTTGCGRYDSQTASEAADTEDVSGQETESPGETDDAGTEETETPDMEDASGQEGQVYDWESWNSTETVDTETGTETADQDVLDAGTEDVSGKETDGTGSEETDATVKTTTITTYVYRDDLPYANVVAGSGTLKVTESYLYYRTGPSMKYPHIGAKPKGTEITVTGQCDDGAGWYVVELDGETYYMSNLCLAGDFTAETTTEEVPVEESWDEAIALDTDGVVETATAMAKSLGYDTVEERYKQKLLSGKITQEEYDFLVSNSRGEYNSVTVRVTEEDVNTVAELLCSRLLPEEGTAFEFTYGGIIRLGKLRYAEFRCYTLD